MPRLCFSLFRNYPPLAAIAGCVPTLNSAKTFDGKNSNLQGAMDERIYKDSGRTYCNRHNFFSARDLSTLSTAGQTPREITRKAGVCRKQEIREKMNLALAHVIRARPRFQKSPGPTPREKAAQTQG